MPRRQLNGMVVIITGASAGIGRALAVALSRGGARLVLGARRMDRLQSLNGELGGHHVVQAWPFLCSVRIARRMSATGFAVRS